MATKVMAAMFVLVEALETNEDYYNTWVDNISMAFQDEYTSQMKGVSGRINKGNLKIISDKAAKRFLSTLHK